jgi:hypothetical protein
MSALKCSKFVPVYWICDAQFHTKFKKNQLAFHAGTELLSLPNRHRVIDSSMKNTVTLFLCRTEKLVHVCSGLSLNCGCHYISEDMALNIQWARELRLAWHTTNLGYDQNFCFDLWPNLELQPAPAPAWRAHIRSHVQFTASACGVCFVLQVQPC